MRSIRLLALSVLCAMQVSVAAESYAQSPADEARARAQYAQGLRDLEGGNPQAAYDYSISARELLGSDNARLSALRVEALVALERWQDAKHEYEYFFTLGPGGELSAEVAALTVRIDQSLNERAAQQSLVRGLIGDERTTSASPEDREGCLLGNMVACGNIASEVLATNEIEPIRTTAIPLLELACDQMDYASCHNLGRAIDLGYVEPGDNLAPADLYQMACSADVSAACSSLGQYYYRNVPSSAEAARFVPLLSRQCDSGLSGACYGLGLSYGQGTALERDWSTAMAMFDRACQLGSSDGCGMFADRLLNPANPQRDFNRGFEIAELACSNRSLVACSSLGIAFNNGRGVRRDRAEAARLYAHSCTEQLEAPQACLYLAFALERGRGVERDLDRSIRMLDRSCRGGNSYACLTIGSKYRDGDGVTRNETRAREYMRRYCDLLNDGRCSH